MYCKLALRNVRRSARDYAIYFVTVALGVALFYAFNAINSQAVLFDALSADSERMLELLELMLKLFSGVVACVLGFLVVYANRFLIRRRKREFGTYLLLGMNARRVSRILLYETSLVGLTSLIIGLGVGISLSQGLSFVTAALMGTTMKKYQFIVSGEAIGFTVLCFALIFIVSALVNIIYIHRCKLASLLSPHQSNERGASPKIRLRIVGFIISIVLLACAYWQLHVNGMVQADLHFTLATALMVAGTFLFFWSVAGILIALFQKTKDFYFHGIRMFTIRQISSKINTTFVSMSVVCIMLFFALSVSSIGLGLVEVFVGNLEDTTRYDATINSYAGFISDTSIDDGYSAERFAHYQGDMTACLSQASEGWKDFAGATAQIDYYLTDATYGDLIAQIPKENYGFRPDIFEEIKSSALRIMSFSQYNQLCSLTQKTGINLNDNECMLNNTTQGYQDLAEAFINQKVSFSLMEHQLHLVGPLQNTPIRTSAISDVALEIIVPDAVIVSLKEAGQVPEYSNLDIMYSCEKSKGDKLLTQYLEKAFLFSENTPEEAKIDYSFQRNAWPCTNYYTALGMKDQATGLRMILTYLALYIGFILLVATAAILAIQQLSETADSLKRYQRLSDLGCNKRTLFGSLRTQTACYFLIPLGLATCHTICAVLVASNALFDALGVNIIQSVCLAAVSVGVVYLIYLLVTYFLSKSIVSEALRKKRG